MTAELGLDQQARGTVAAGFEPVARTLEHAVTELGEDGCAVAAYVGGQKVVDLWAGTADGRPWQEDTIALFFSCTKGLLALCSQVLADRGLLDVDAPVTRYWPEYGAAGKGETTVRHLLTHTAGVVSYPRYWDDIGLEGLEIADWDLITGRLAESPPTWEPGSNCFYHALTLGFLVGEVIRRIDGRKPGRFFAEEIAAPLGLDLYIGVPESATGRVATILPAPPRDLSKLNEQESQLATLIDALFSTGREAVRAGKSIEPEALLWSATFMHPDLEDANLHLPNVFNQPRVQAAEVPAGNGIGGARDLARMYALLAGGGELDGVRLVSAASIEVFNQPQTRWTPDLPPFCLGYQRLPAMDPGPSETAFGHGGAGGSLGFADPERNVSFGFVKNRMRNEPHGAGEQLVRALYECL